MGRLKRGLRNAFAVDAPGPAQPTAEQQPAVDWVCRQIAMRHLTTPGLIFLEMWRPMNWVSAQFLHMVQPVVWALLRQQSYESYVKFSEFLEHRGSMDYMCRRIEEFESEYEGKGQGGRANRPASSLPEKMSPEQPSQDDPSTASPQDRT